MLDIFNYLQKNSYSGRAIMLGKLSQDTVRIVYFIMGRSENSQNRVFEECSDGFKTRVYDEAKLTDPSLIIYHPLRQLEDGSVVVTNGDQTDTIAKTLSKGKCFRYALKRRTFEPDEPNFTPRISGVVKPDGTYALSILKTIEHDPQTLARFFFEYDEPKEGVAHFISTYDGDGEPLPSFSGEPLLVNLSQSSLADFSVKLWKSLNTENKVALYVADYDVATHNLNSLITNKHEKKDA